MKTYAQLKWLKELGQWSLKDDTVNFTDIGTLVNDSDEKYLFLSIKIRSFGAYTIEYKQIENIPVYTFDKNCTKLEELQMTEIIVDYLNLGFENLKKLGCEQQYLELIKTTEDFL